MHHALGRGSAARLAVRSRAVLFSPSPLPSSPFRPSPSTYAAFTTLSRTVSPFPSSYASYTNLSLAARRDTSRAIRPILPSNTSHYFRNTMRRPFSTSPSDESYDVIVVGSGVAGLCASIAAAENGASVLLIDRAHGGGATALSGGVVYAGGGTKQQIEAGIDYDTPENMLAYLRLEVGDAVRESTLRRFCDESTARMAWLEAHGVRFNSALCPYKTSLTTDEHYLSYSGNETSHPFRDAARPAPRGHRVHHPGFSGIGLVRSLTDAALRLGVRFLPATKATNVVRDPSTGAVVGLGCRSLPAHHPAFAKHQALCRRVAKYQLTLPFVAGPAHRRAEALWEENAPPPSVVPTRAVVLAAGGFAFNAEMREKYLPQWSRVGSLGTPADDGSGILLGQAAGGAVARLDRMSAWRFLYPPTALVEGVVVGPDGTRIAAEDVYGAMLSEAMVLHHGGKGYAVLDAATWAKAKRQLWTQVPMPVRIQRAVWLYWAYEKADSVEALASKLGVDARGLCGTVDAYNSAIEDGRPDPLRKVDEYRSPVSRGPFYGIEISVAPDGVHLTPGLTLGGLAVDEDTGMVLDEEKKMPIPGLYAAGRNAVGLCSNGYISGLSLADGVFSGKRAGEDIAARVAAR
ncbi:hypothetical protein ACRALDRAFT_2041872 [Sodiomyces alcalophilus JCM 7366]|uniref:uncharacterized protein n=1 Tax=Sodiomyces alcalophilus JCM 7366 TaxID=591952 RepID=UPI0039B51693